MSALPPEFEHSGRAVAGWQPDEPRVDRVDVGPDSTFNELLKENSRLRRRLTELETLANTHSTIVVADRRGVILKVNRNFLATLQYSREEVVGKPLHLVNSARHGSEFYWGIWRTIARGNIWQGEVCSRAKDGSEVWGTTTIIPVLDERGRPERYVAIRNDITRLHDMERELRRLAYFDVHTGLPSRTSVLSALEVSVHRRTQEWCAFVSVSLDDLTDINDAFGYVKGESLIQHASSRLRTLGDPVKIVGHIDTGVFGLLLEGLGESCEEAEAKTIAVTERVLASICGRASLGAGVEIENTATAGFRLYVPGQEGLDADEVIKSAEIARRHAQATRTSVHGFVPQMLEETKSQVDLVLDLRKGIAEGALCLYLQPIVDAERRPVSYEGLVRWMDGKRGLVAPSEFIPLAERTGLIEDIGAWVLDEASRILAEWRLDPEMRALKLAINVSERQLRRANFADLVRDTLTRHGAAADRLQLELTESALQSDILQTISTLRDLNQDHVLVALDDFGTGYSSLSYLRQLPVQQLKIDRSFVKEIADDPLDAELVRSIVELAHYMGLSVVAEGVETEVQFDVLKGLGIDAFQGFLFGRPRLGPLPTDQEFVRETSGQV